MSNAEQRLNKTEMIKHMPDDNNNEVLYWTMAYKMSDAILTLSDLGALDIMSNQPLSSKDVASELNLFSSALKPLLDLLVSGNVLECIQDKYALTTKAVTSLPMIKLEAKLRRWHFDNNSLAKILKTGIGSDPIVAVKDKKLFDTYFDAMAHSIRSVALHMLHFTRLNESRNVVDLGGADGALVEQFSKFLPKDAVFTVVDRDTAMPFFKKRFTDLKEKDKFQFIAQDLTASLSDLSELINEADAVILSNVLHLISTNNRNILLKMLCDCMKKKAKLVVYDQFVSTMSKTDAAGFMVVDWVNCGSLFDLNESDLVVSLEKSRLIKAKASRFPKLPGAIVYGIKLDSKDE